VERDLGESPDVEGGAAEVVLEVAELALDGGAAAVEAAPLVAVAGDSARSVETVGQHRGG